MIHSLQSIRFILAILIFFHHYLGIPPFGPYPVAFFFVLSGFLVSLGYAEKVTGESFSYRKFIIKRFARIYPLNLIGLILWLIFPIAIGIYVGEIKGINCVLILDLLLVQSWWPESFVFFSGNIPCWFLSDIVFCYSVFPFLIKFAKNHNHLIWFTSIMFVYFLVVNFVPNEYDYNIIYINPLLRIFDFVVGIELYFFYNRINDSRSCKNSLQQKTILELSSIILTISFMLLYPYTPPRYSYVSLFWVPSVFTILIFSLHSNYGGVLSKILEKKCLCYFGKLSFPFYVFHLVSITWVDYLMSKIGVHSHTAGGAILCIIGTTFVSIIYVKYIEPLFTNELRKLYE